MIIELQSCQVTESSASNAALLVHWKKPEVKWERPVIELIDASLSTTLARLSQRCDHWPRCVKNIIIIIIINIIISDNPEFDAQVPASISLNTCQRLLQDGLQLFSHIHVHRDTVHCCNCLPEWKGISALLPYLLRSVPVHSPQSSIGRT